MALTEIPSELSSTPSIVDNGNSTAITIDASENVTLAGTATMGGLTLDGNNSYTSNIKFDYGASAPTYFSNWGYKSSSDGNKVFLTMTDGGAAKDVLVANYNGNVGIGVSSPQRSLVLGKGDSTGVQTQYTNSTTGAALGDGFTVGIDGSENAEFWNFENTNMLFATNGTERLRIDGATGNLLAGTTTTNIATEGTVLYGGSNKGVMQLSTINKPALYVNRSNTGDLVQFRTGGSTVVGSIGVYSSDRLFIGAGDTNLTFKPSHDIFYPSTATGAARDNAIDIGDSGARFKDLHLSGTMIGNILKLRQSASSMYVSPINANTLNANYDEDSDNADMWINYRGYQGGFSRFRDFRVGNGKGAVLLLVDGSAASVAITGSLSVSSSFSKGSGSFKIDHPLPAKTETHHLVHSFIEGPQADNIYRGKIDLVDGSATVNIDTAAGMTEGTYVLLNTNTQCFTSNESGWTAVKGSVSGNILTITAQDNTCTETISWMVVGERHDQHMIDTEWTDGNGKVVVEPLKELEEETTMENN